MSRKARCFWPLLLALFVADCATKRAAESHLAIGAPQPLVGEVLRLTLSYNPAAAMGIEIGSDSRTVLTVLSIAVLMILVAVYRHTAAEDRWRAVGLGLVAGGALGNLLDRLRSPAGVVDFIDVGLGDARFWTFNIADVGITIGAVLLLFVFRRGVPAPVHLPPLRGPRSAPPDLQPTGD